MKKLITVTAALLVILGWLIFSATHAQAQDYTVGASVTVPLNMKDIGNRGTFTLYGETCISRTNNYYTTIDNSVTTKTNKKITNNTTNNTNNNTNNNNNVKVSGHSNIVVTY